MVLTNKQDARRHAESLLGGQVAGRHGNKHPPLGEASSSSSRRLKQLLLPSRRGTNASAYTTITPQREHVVVTMLADSKPDAEDDDALDFDARGYAKDPLGGQVAGGHGNERQPLGEASLSSSRHLKQPLSPGRRGANASVHATITSLREHVVVHMLADSEPDTEDDDALDFEARGYAKDPLGG